MLTVELEKHRFPQRWYDSTLVPLFGIVKLCMLSKVQRWGWQNLAFESDCFGWWFNAAISLQAATACPDLFGCVTRSRRMPLPWFHRRVNQNVIVTWTLSYTTLQKRSRLLVGAGSPRSVMMVLWRWRGSETVTHQATYSILQIQANLS